MADLRVVVSGSGRMGSEILGALEREEGLEPVGVVEKFSSDKLVALPSKRGEVPLSSDPEELFARLRPDVVIDFTNAEWTPIVARAAVGNGVRPVIGTSGIPEGFVAELRGLCEEKEVGAFIAPN